uniref:Uncharacterized protein n=1 Tax=Vitis vinifera TaxID=29760 RepID=A5BP74_VITVI|nr:hypothetical protein VITISV_014435 [Vitis vinifera]
MDCVRPILDVATRLWDSAAKRPVYIRHLPQNLNSLRTEMEELKNLYEDVKERVEREEKRQKKRLRVVDGWLRGVEAIEKEVEEILAKGDEEIQKKCLGTCYPKNCGASYNLGKMVLEKMDAVTVKKTEGSNFSVVAEPLPSPPVMERQLEKTVGQDLLFGKVWKWLQDGGEQVSSIGLYGMGGVGKTTLLTRINNELLKTRLEFDAVIWVTVSRPANVEKVQRVLFNKVEIPQDKWEDKLKMVLTTRSKDVCQDMEVTESIEMNCLPWEDAFALFQTKVGADTINSHPDIPKLAEMVAKECCGLPLALITIGRAMAGTKTPEEWEKKIQMLKNYPAKFPGMENRLFSRLAFSYDSLPDETIKSCFLYCSLFPEDYEISHRNIIQLWIGEGFLDECDNIQKARNQGEEVIKSLQLACLLENGISPLDEKDEYLKMHDVIRDMALWLAHENGKKKNKFVLPVEIRNLVTLQYLNLSCTSIEYLPVELKNLKKLRCLILNDMYFLESLPSQMVSSLSSLQLFSMYSTEGSAFKGYDERRLLEELEQLEHIDDISIDLTSVSSIQTLFNSHKLQRSTRWLQLVCERMNLVQLSLYIETLHIKNCFELQDVKINFENEVVVYSKFPRHPCLNNLCDVKIFRCHKLLNLTWLICAPSLQFLSVEFCESMEKVIDDERSEVLEIEVDHLGVFSRLISLTLTWLPKLRSIYGRALPFPSLRYIRVLQCPSLRKLPFDSNTGISKKLEQIRGQKEWWDGLDWEDQVIMHNLTPYFQPTQIQDEI